ncbi:MAG TPA: VWA domain-containing protein [Thermoanaerobaculia bacterium]|nr:VWA domain-containing protein [Thermoanaerobaculia bacterium]
MTARNERRVHGVATLCLLVLAAAILASCGDPSSSPAGSDKKNTAPAANKAGTLTLLFTYGSEKEDWIKEVTRRFNAGDHRTAAGKSIQVEAVAQGSGELIDDLLSGARKAHLTSPASAAFLKLGNAQSRARTGKDLIGESRNLVLSPVVIAMWRPMAETLGWGSKPLGWSDVLALAKDQNGWASHGHPEWGAFKLGHTHPEYSNSGLISLLAEAYAGAGKVTGLSLADVRRPQTARYVAGIESAIVHYGSSTGFFGKRMFEGGPGYLSAAVLYENMVIESYGPEYRMPFPVVAIYPKEGTFWSDHPVGIVEREWVTPEHREAAKLYVDYLLDRPQQEAALRFGFRPAAVEVPLAAPIDAAHGVDPKQPQTTLEVPSVEVIDGILNLWRENKKRSDVTLVLDRSGSMREEDKMANAQAGADQFLTLLDPADSFSFLTFNASPAWVIQGAKLSESKTQVSQALHGVFPDGGTALYDAIALAYDQKVEEVRKDPGKIAAIVVLTDGADTDSRLGLRELVQKFHTGSESQGVRVFTIGYGKDARKDVLKSIADATQARFYEGNPATIRTVFRDISTFF